MRFTASIEIDFILPVDKTAICVDFDLKFKNGELWIN